jgi:hypothetical protein
LPFVAATRAGAQPLFVPPGDAAVPAPAGLAANGAAPAEAAAGRPLYSQERLAAVISEIILEQMPHQYEDTSKWGGTTRVWDGLHVHREGLQIKTKRRFKEVNHGAWTLYRVALVDPQHEFRVAVENERELDGGMVGFDLVFTARIDAFARRSRWVKGVQLVSLSVNADAVVSLRLSCQLASYFDLSALPPDVVFDPRVTAAKLELVEFNVRRISDVGGAVAHELGEAMKGILQRKVAEKGDQLAGKLNAKIDARRDDLRLSLRELAASQWSKLQDYIRPQEAP